VTSSSMRPILLTHSSGMVGPPIRPISTDAQQWRGMVCLFMLPIAMKLGCYPSMGTNSRHFWTFSTRADAIFVMLRLPSFDLLYSGRLVVDSFRIVELLQIC